MLLNEVAVLETLFFCISFAFKHQNRFSICPSRIAIYLLKGFVQPLVGCLKTSARERERNDSASFSVEQVASFFWLG